MLGEVLVPDELPPYLLLGRLDRSTFQSGEAGWSARWTGDVPDTYVEAKYARAERRLTLRQVWRGIEGGTSFTGIPDGGFKTLCVPVPVGRLADLYRGVDEMRDDPQLMTPVSVRLELRSLWIGSNAESPDVLLRKAATSGNGRWSNLVTRCTEDCTRQIAGP